MGTYKEISSSGLDIAKTIEDEDLEQDEDNMTRSFSECELETSISRCGSISNSSRHRMGSVASRSSVKEVLVCFGNKFVVANFFSIFINTEERRKTDFYRRISHIW